MGKVKPITIKIAPDQIDFFGAVLNCAVRYCIGRMTYMPGLVTDWIMQHCHGLLTNKTLYVMKRDKFREYMRWLFDILDTYEEDCAEMEDESAEKPRIMGFVAERLFGIYYTYQLMHGARCAEVPYLRFYNTEPEQCDADGEGVQDNHNSPVREFTLKPTNFKVKINMRKLSKLCPAGSRRRVFLRSLLYR